MQWLELFGTLDRKAGQSRQRKLQATASPAELQRLRDTEPNYAKELQLLDARLAALDREQA